MTRILVVEDDVKTRLLVVKVLKQLGELGKEEITYTNSNIFELRIPESRHCQIRTNHTTNRDHGWYRKFEKKSKKR
jgi:CheY-like chemotaxis protein